jgi:hypothetical protein
MTETQTPSADIGSLCAPFMDYLDGEAPEGTEVYAALVVAYTSTGIYWRVRGAGSEDDPDDRATARLALSLADAALTAELEGENDA